MGPLKLLYLYYGKLTDTKFCLRGSVLLLHLMLSKGQSGRNCIKASNYISFVRNTNFIFDDNKSSPLFSEALGGHYCSPIIVQCSFLHFGLFLQCEKYT